ncbi:MAG: RNA polymerase sigma factor [Saprospiraceae bacterium]|nr:RNA polymerase sigma factor [Saprospiraceae bacterium]
MEIHSTLNRSSGLNLLLAPLKEQQVIQNELDQIIEGCLKGKRQAQQRLYQKFYNQVFGVCLRYASDRLEAKSLVNSTFLKVFKSLQQFDKKGAFGAWLSRIAINVSIDHVRKQNRYRQHTTTVPEMPEVAANEEILSKMATEDIIECIQKVSPTSRTVFSLYVIDGYKHGEIAEMLGISVGTSRWHLSNAKKELQELLKNYF